MPGDFMFNKYLKRFREHHTRKASRVQTNKDLFRKLLLHSESCIVLCSFHIKTIKTRRGCMKTYRISQVSSDISGKYENAAELSGDYDEI